jgi:hypothetical protein
MTVQQVPSAPTPRETETRGVYPGSRFSEVWRAVTSDPYVRLPNEDVSLRAFFRGFAFRLAQAARRTLADPHDTLPPFQKLIRPNGLCMSGVWRITQPNPYTGGFANGYQAQLVARASVAMRETRSGQYRSFGMAGKLFPSRRLDADERVKTANFFVIDDNGGTRLSRYCDATMTTQPGLSVNPSSVGHGAILIAIQIAQRMADRNTERRQLYPIAEIGSERQPRAPRWMMVRGSPSNPMIRADDFRDEVRQAVLAGPVVFEILVRDDAARPWGRLGEIEIREAVASHGCDHRLHFSHPRWRKEAP